MNDSTSLGARMKRYEFAYKTTVTPHTYTIIRVDGRAFHTYLKKARKPFDYDVSDMMTEVSIALCSDIAGARFSYQQSDEISVLLTDLDDQSESWFGGVVQKMASVAAATATAAMVASQIRRDRSDLHGLPSFDGRVFSITNPVEVANYFIWRQRDAIKNSISMAAQAVFSHKRLQGLNSDQRQELLFQEKQINWNDYPDRAKRGMICTRTTYRDTVTYTHKKTGKQDSVECERTKWIGSPAPRFTASDGDFLSAMIPRWPVRES